MTELGSWWWFIVVVGGTVVLGLGIAYGAMHNRKRTQREKLVSERGAHDIYQKEDRAHGP